MDGSNMLLANRIYNKLCKIRSRNKRWNLLYCAPGREGIESGLSQERPRERHGRLSEENRVLQSHISAIRPRPTWQVRTVFVGVVLRFDQQGETKITCPRVQAAICVFISRLKPVYVFPPVVVIVKQLVYPVLLIFLNLFLGIGMICLSVSLLFSVNLWITKTESSRGQEAVRYDQNSREETPKPLKTFIFLWAVIHHTQTHIHTHAHTQW